MFVPCSAFLRILAQVVSDLPSLVLTSFKLYVNAIGKGLALIYIIHHYESMNSSSTSTMKIISPNNLKDTERREKTEKGEHFIYMHV